MAYQVWLAYEQYLLGRPVDVSDLVRASSSALELASLGKNDTTTTANINTGKTGGGSPIVIVSSSAQSYGFDDYLFISK